MSKSDEKSTKILPDFQDVGHFNLAAFFSLEAFKSALKYKPRSDDLFIVTYPKCGTTWVQNIVACIYRNGKPFSNALEFFNNTPFLELLGAEVAETMERPGAIKVHLPFHLTPYSPDAKYIFVTRNPKDCCVSFYHHTKNMPLYHFENGSFDDYFELFIDGKVDFGDYFDTVLSWYAHRHDPNVLFLSYEDMKKDIKKNIMKIAAFMGEKYKDALESDPKLLKDVIHYSSFNYMKETMNKQLENMNNTPVEMMINNEDVPQGLRHILLQKKEGSVLPESQHVRKGIVGDWKNYFSEEQNRRMDAKFQERMKGTDFIELWQEDMCYNS